MVKQDCSVELNDSEIDKSEFHIPSAIDNKGHSSMVSLLESCNGFWLGQIGKGWNWMKCLFSQNSARRDVKAAQLKEWRVKQTEIWQAEKSKREHFFL